MAWTHPKSAQENSTKYLNFTQYTIWEFKWTGGRKKRNLGSQKNSILVEKESEVASEIEAASQPFSSRNNQLGPTIWSILAQVIDSIVKGFSIWCLSIPNSPIICYGCTVTSATYGWILKGFQNPCLSPLHCHSCAQQYSKYQHNYPNRLKKNIAKASMPMSERALGCQCVRSQVQVHRTTFCCRSNPTY